MAEPSPSVVPDVRPYLAVGAAQLVLTVLAVLISRVEELGDRLGMLAVMLVAVVNGGMVAVFTMGVRRDGRLIAGLAVLALVLMAGLLVWPGLDISQRGRHF